MTRRNLVKLGLAAMLLGLTALPAKADLVTVTEFDGTNAHYVANVTSLGGGFGLLTLTFNTTNMVYDINSNLLSPSLNSIWNGPGGTGIYSTTYLVSSNMDGSVNLNDLTTGPGTGGDIGIQDDTGVVLNYQANFGQSSVPGIPEGLNLSGIVNVDTANFPGNPTAYVSTDGNTYDFSPFLPGANYMTSFIVTLNSSADIIDALLSGTPSSFAGTASFTMVATAVPEPASAMLLCMGGLIVGAVGRRRRKA